MSSNTHLTSVSKHKYSLSTLFTKLCETGLYSSKHRLTSTNRIDLSLQTQTFFIFWIIHNKYTMIVNVDKILSLYIYIIITTQKLF